MIDWQAKAQQLKASADELELWAGKSEGHVRLVLGRTADELRLLARDIELALHEPPSQVAAEPQPEWLADGMTQTDNWAESGEVADDSSGEWQPLE